MENIKTTLNNFVQSFPVFMEGTVWLVGAGPGDPGLLTLHALHALQNADHILYDALVEDSILQFANKNAVLEFAGKRGGKPSLKQEEITQRMIMLAQNGKRVLRLKGGDPFVFGRGGEEAKALMIANIPFRIIPGISAGIAGPAYAGIPVTNRRINQSVLFLTGHDADGGIPKSFDWKAIANASPVIIFFMAMRYIDEISQNLINAGRSPDESIAFISNATTKNQKVVITTLERAEKVVKDEIIKSPAIIVIGHAADEEELLNWLPFG